MLIRAPALQLLLNLLCELCLEIDMLCNFEKTLSMICTPNFHDKIVSHSFHAFKIGEISLQFSKSSSIYDTSSVTVLQMMPTLTFVP